MEKKNLADQETKNCNELADFPLARKILGQNFIHPLEVVRQLGVSYTENQLTMFRETLPMPEILTWCQAHNFILIPGPPSALTLVEIRRLIYRHTNRFDHDPNRFDPYDDIDCFDQIKTHWLMLNKNYHHNCENLTWEEQLTRLSAAEFVPNAAEAIWGFSLYYDLIRHARKTLNFFEIGTAVFRLRTSSITTEGNRIWILFINGIVQYYYLKNKWRKNLEIHKFDDVDRGCPSPYDAVGLVRARKL